MDQSLDLAAESRSTKHWFLRYSVEKLGAKSAKLGNLWQSRFRLRAQMIVLMPRNRGPLKLVKRRKKCRHTYGLHSILEQIERMQGSRNAPQNQISMVFVEDDDHPAASSTG